MTFDEIRAAQAINERLEELLPNKLGGMAKLGHITNWYVESYDDETITIFAYYTFRSCGWTDNDSGYATFTQAELQGEQA